MPDPIQNEFVEAGFVLVGRCLTVRGGWAPGADMDEQLEEASAASDRWIQEVFERISELPRQQQFVAARWVIEGQVCRTITSVLEARWRLAPGDN